MTRRSVVALLLALGGLYSVSRDVSSVETFLARDPGVRAGAAVSEPLANLTPDELQLFRAGHVEFAEAESVADGLGPAMNLDNCGGCHSQPAFGGTSPPLNPQFALAKQSRAGSVPSFISPNGPVRVARFVRKPDGTPDGEVHALFTIAGRLDAPGCVLPQPDFAAALANRNVIFRIPTPVFGLGLVEMIPDSAILANRAANTARNKTLGIAGRVHVAAAADLAGSRPMTGESGRGVARFGWKAQNSTLLTAAAEAYQVEMGITNEVFQTEGVDAESCPYVNPATHAKGAAGEYGSDTGELFMIDTMRRYQNPLGHRYLMESAELRERRAAFGMRNSPEREKAHTAGSQVTIDDVSSVEKFVFFMRFLAPPRPSADTPGGASSIARGKDLFVSVGCAACHTPGFVTGPAAIAALRNQPVNLYSDLLLHDMGAGLADGVTQGGAGPREFRTAPLWGLGQRIFFLHDGRTTDLLEAIAAHRSGSAQSGDASTANGVVANFNLLGEPQKQDVLNFLRAL